MADQSYYAREAQRCHDLAASAPDAKAARRWHRLADQYAVLAEELDAHIHHRAPILTAQPVQQQLQQQLQQQSRLRARP
jgi:hypothetical protein